MSEEYIQESLPGFFDDESRSDRSENSSKEQIEKSFEEGEEYVSEFHNTQEFYESPNGLRIEHNPSSKNYLAVLEKNPLANVVQKKGFSQIVKEQLNYVKVKGESHAGHTMPIITAGEFDKDGSFVGLYRNRFRGSMPGGDNNIFRADTECHLIKTSKDKRGRRVDVVKISLPPYGVDVASPMFTIRKDDKWKINPGSELQKKIIDFENNPESMDFGTLNGVFDELMQKFD